MTSIFPILIFQSEDESQINEVFTLNEGDNTIGSDIDCDIVIQLSDKSIESFHAKLIVSEGFNDIALEDISISNTIFKERNGMKIRLKKQREYEVFPMRTFYLTSKMKFFLFEGTITQIENFLSQHKLNFYFEYLKEKFKVYDKQPEIENTVKVEDIKQNKNEVYEGKSFNVEDFNNFDYVPGDEEYFYNNKVDSYNQYHHKEGNENYSNDHEQFEYHKKKVLAEVMDSSTNIKNKEIQQISHENGIHKEEDDEDDFSKILSQRLRKKKIKNSTINVSYLNKKHI